MTQSNQTSLAKRFRDLHTSGRLLLPNAWDAASARIFEEAGFAAIGTTSFGIARARGLCDGQQISRDAMVREIASIVAAVERPVTADIEAGYGPAPADVAETVGAVLDAGAVGVNLEDSTGATPGPLFTVADQMARIGAARSAAESRSIPLVINARTDTFLLGLGGDIEQRVAMSIERGRAYLQAGADLIFIPGLIDPPLVARVAAEIGGPISLMVLPGAPNADALFSAGACRVSLGAAAILATLGALREIANETRGGTWNALFARS